MSIAAHSIAASSADEGDIAVFLKKTEAELAKAVVNRDYDTLRRIEAETYLYTDGDAHTSTREEFIHNYQTGTTEIKSLHFDEISVRTYGDTAVVTGRLTINKSDRGKTVFGVFHYTRVYIRFPEGWRAIVGHSSKVVDEL
jgi:ketosteroid isomerase-like protein